MMKDNVELISEQEIENANMRKRADWERNTALISAAYTSFWNDHQRFPTQKELAVITGLSPMTIHRHWRSFSTEQAFLFYREFLQAKNPQVLTALYTKAASGDVSAIKLFLQLSFSFTNSGVINDPYDTTPKIVEDTPEKVDDIKKQLEKFARNLKREEEFRSGKSKQ